MKKSENLSTYRMQKPKFFHILTPETGKHPESHGNWRTKTPRFRAGSTVLKHKCFENN
jgi:hypothetical protein